MSNDGEPASDPQPRPPSASGGCLSVLAVLFGIALLLPGLCLVVVLGSGIKLHADEFFGIGIPVVLVAALGVWIIRAAWRRK